MSNSENNNEVNDYLGQNDETEFQRQGGQQSNQYIETSLSSRQEKTHYNQYYHQNDLKSNIGSKLKINKV